MPKSPDDMSDAAVKRRAVISQDEKALAARKGDLAAAKAEKVKVAKRR